MFSLYQNGLVPGAHNTWTHWVDRIMKKKDKFGFSKVTMITTRGSVLWHTKNFLPTSAEVQHLNKIFDLDIGDSRCCVAGDQRLTIAGRTYITKAVPDNCGRRQMVAFSGSNYVIISRSKSVYIIVQTEGRRATAGQTWLTEALSWLDKLCQVLVERNY